MSRLSTSIELVTEWVEHSAPHYPDEFIADLRALLTAAKAAQQALQVLQKAQRYALREVWCDKTGKAMEPSAFGDWISIDDVVPAIQILREG